MSCESLKSFYDGKTLFITGATGFMGRILLAKLMRMGNLKEILLLSRPKKGKSNKERIDDILDGFLFKDLEKFDPKFKEKLKIVNGDMEVEDLGISMEDREYIKNNVEIIIHGAATVRFDEVLRKAVTINVQGTKNLLDIATEVKSLEKFVHISTAFSHCPMPEIDEEFYKPPVDYKLALSLVKSCDDEFLHVITRKLINPWPNTYTFTKAIAEDVVRQYENKIPIAVVRPSLGI
jgi:alcohol-forming fatty acyl-CoA reductase